MKKLILILGLLAAGLVIAAGVVVFNIDAIAKRAIERSSTRALGVETRVSSVSVGLLSGEFSLRSLEVANPNGFKAKQFLSLGSGSVAASLSTLRQPTVKLPHFKLDELEVNIEKRGGRANYAAILDHVRQTAGSGKSGDDSGETKYIVDDLDLTNITIRADMGSPAPLSEFTRVTIPIDRIRLRQVGRTGTGVAGTGVTLEELATIIVHAVLSAAKEKGGGLLPPDLLNDLGEHLAGLGELGKLPVEIIAGTAGTIENVGKKLLEEGAKTIEGAVDQGKKAIDEATEKVKGLLPGEKKK